MKALIGTLMALYYLVLGVFGLGNDLVDGQDLTQKQLSYFEEIGAINGSEEIIFFSSSFTWKKSGSIISDQGIGSFWLDGSDFDHVSKAYYGDIYTIEKRHMDGFEFTSFLEITLNLDDDLKVYFDVSDEELDEVYNRVLEQLERSMDK